MDSLPAPVRPGTSSASIKDRSVTSDNAIPARPRTAGGSRPALSQFSSLSLEAPNPHAAMNPASAVIQREFNNDTLLRILGENEAFQQNEVIMMAESGNAAGIAALIEHGRDLSSCRGLSGYTSLHHACNRGHVAVVSAILKGFLVLLNSMNDSGETPLHLAVYAGNMNIVEQLLDYGADIDARNTDGETPLIYAARKSMPALVRLLLQRGADPSIEDRFGDKAVDHATSKSTLQALETQPVEQVSKLSYRWASNLVVYELLYVNAMIICYQVGATFALTSDVLKRVFEFLGAKELCRSACVSGRWHRISESEDIWNKLGVKRWQLALQSSLGFAPPAASLFSLRPRTSFRNDSTHSQSQSQSSRQSSRSSSFRGSVSVSAPGPASASSTATASASSSSAKN
jgi:Ankyrin repeats (3 copies)/F-box domain/Ankyrin repeat